MDRYVRDVDRQIGDYSALKQIKDGMAARQYSRQQLGQLTNSVLVLRMRQPCRSENDVRRTKSTEKGAESPICSTRTPSPAPSDRREPIFIPIWRASSSVSVVSVWK